MLYGKSDERVLRIPACIYLVVKFYQCLSLVKSPLVAATTADSSVTSQGSDPTQERHPSRFPIDLGC